MKKEMKCIEKLISDDIKLKRGEMKRSMGIVNDVMGCI
jgi:transcription elongation factor